MEGRVWLTTVELARASNVVGTTPLLARPAPGERASYYALMFWVLLSDDTVQVVWDAAFSGIKVVFSLHGDGDKRYQGTATYFTDDLGAPSANVPMTVERIECE